ncbi:hypothetical protein GCM10017322_05100 [Paracoccus aerius]|nr:hypothetical protein GCM10017322_05100 [Paracoccus aerius]
MPAPGFGRGSGRSADQRTEPCPIIDFGVPCMFDLQTEMHLRRAGRDDQACGARPGHGRMLLVLANVTGLALLAAALT